MKVLPASDAREVYAALHGGRRPSVRRPEHGSYEDAEVSAMPRGMSYELSAGDLVAARVKRGAPDLDPWRLEGLGREHEMVMWSFETEEAARTALGLPEERVVRPRRDSTATRSRWAPRTGWCRAQHRRDDRGAGHA